MRPQDVEQAVRAIGAEREAQRLVMDLRNAREVKDTKWALERFQSRVRVLRKRRRGPGVEGAADLLLSLRAADLDVVR